MQDLLKNDFLVLMDTRAEEVNRLYQELNVDTNANGNSIRNTINVGTIFNNKKFTVADSSANMQQDLREKSRWKN